MDAWCPRCEWVGTATAGRCPRCGTPLIQVESQLPPKSPVEPPGPTAAVDPIDDPIAAPEPRPRRWILVTAIAAAIAVGAGLLHQGPGPRPAPTVARAVDRAGFPPRLAYLVGADGASGETLVLASGDGRDPTRDLRQGAGSGLAGPADPERLQLPRTLAVPGALAFAWAPDGRHWLVLDAERHLRVFPRVGTVLGHVLDASFSPDGQYLAVCSERTWPPTVTVAPVSDPAGVIAGPVAGCDPRWDFDGHYLAYRLPRRHSSHPGYATDSIGVLNTYVGLEFRVPGTWPPVWAPPPRFAITPLTVIAPNRRQVEVMDQRGGQPHTVVSATDLDGVVGGRTPGPLVLVAWSPNADRLAVGIAGAVDGAEPGVVVYHPEEGFGTFTPGPAAPTAFGWSTMGSLLVQFDPPTGAPVSEVIEPGGHVDALGPARDGTWSADGRWVLARTDAGWFAFDPDHPGHTMSMGTGSKAWLVARWCCPPSAVVEEG